MQITYSECKFMGGRQTQQDSLLSFSIGDEYFFVLCDGHFTNGGIFSEYVVNKSKEFFEQHIEIFRVNPIDTIKNFFLSISRDEYLLSITDGGTTCTLVAIMDRKIYCANIGDSEVLYKVKSSSDYKILTTCHSPLNMDEYDRIKNNFQDTFNDLKFVQLSLSNSMSFGNKSMDSIYYTDFRGNTQYVDEDSLIDSITNRNKSNAYISINGRSRSIAMTRGFGDYDFNKYGLISVPDISVTDVEDNSVLCIGSDGIWNIWSYYLMSKFLCGKIRNIPREIKQQANYLVHVTQRRYLEACISVSDNQSCFIVNINEDLNSKHPPIKSSLFTINPDHISKIASKYCGLTKKSYNKKISLFSDTTFFNNLETSFEIEIPVSTFRPQLSAEAKSFFPKVPIVQSEIVKLTHIRNSLLPIIGSQYLAKEESDIIEDSFERLNTMIHDLSSSELLIGESQRSILCHIIHQLEPIFESSRLPKVELSIIEYILLKMNELYDDVTYDESLVVESTDQTEHTLKCFSDEKDKLTEHLQKCFSDEKDKLTDIKDILLPLLKSKRLTKQELNSIRDVCGKLDGMIDQY